MNNSGHTRNSQETWKCYKPQYHYGSIQDWIVHHLRQKETHGKISCTNLSQYRHCLIGGILKNLAPLQSCRCQITEILLYMHLKLIQPLGDILQIRIISYMEIRTYFHIHCNYSQTCLITNPPSKKIPLNQFHSQQFICLQWLYIWIRQRQLTFLDTVAMGLTTDMQTYKSLNPVQHLFHKIL